MVWLEKKSVSGGSSFGVGIHHVPTAPIWQCGGRPEEKA